MNEAPLRVMHLVSCLGRGGMEAGVMKLVTGCDPRRIVADVCSLERAQAYQELFGRNSLLHEVPRRSAFDWRLVRRVAAIMRERRVDVVHSHAWGTLLEGWLSARLAGVKHVVHGEHGTMELRPLNVRLQRVLWRRVDRLLAVSDELATRMTAHVDAPRDRITVIPNGVDTERFGSVDRTEARARLGISAHEFLVVAIGRLVPVKNYPLLINAARALKNDGVPVRVLVAGDGPLRGELEQQIEASGLRDVVRLLGVRNDTPALLAACDVFTLTSWSEGMSNTILEAMAARCPVVATRVGGNPELVEDGDTGLLFAPDSLNDLVGALRAVASDRPWASRLGAQGRRRAETDFSVSAMISRYTALYETVTHRQPASSARLTADKSLLLG